MPDEETKPPTTDQEAPPAGEADQEAPPETPETKAEEAPPSEEEKRFTQATFTKLTQEYADRFRAMQAEIAELRASRAGPPPEETPENPQVDKVLRGSKAYRDLVADRDQMRETLRSIAEVTVLQSLSAQFPDLKAEMPSFLAWVKENPNRIAAIQSGAISESEAVAAYRVSHPATKRGTPPTTRTASKPVPRLETASTPRGVSRDIREKVREKTGKAGRLSVDDVWEDAVKEARRETPSEE